MNIHYQNRKDFMQWLKIIVVIVTFTILNACGNVNTNQNQVESNEKQLLNKHAHFFELSENDGNLQLIVKNPFADGKQLSRYLLLPHGTKVPEGISSDAVIFVPVQRMITLSSTQWAPMLELGVSNLIVGISESMYVRDNRMLRMLKEGQVTDVAKDGMYKLEKILSLQPDLIVYSPDAQGIPPALERTGIKFLAWPDYFETNPLGRAEWLKVVGALTGKLDEANSMFEAVETQYQQLAKLVEDVAYRPTVFADKMFAGQWYIPGGNSYTARLFRDAGADYVFSDVDATASVPLDPEVIFSRASNADYWRIAQAAGPDYTYQNIFGEDARYANFKAFKEKKILFCNTAVTSYFEKGAYEPHRILADFIYAFHPSLLPDYQPVYHSILP